ncbi:MAG TPA: multiheme c-type cytochrome [Polyangiaceae bacterium]|nr:multiheme c-type cytochrome [Polyangiaceae bacterium]
MAASLAGLGGCRRGETAKTEPPSQPSLRIYALGGPAGAIEPCGCVKDMLGGVDHAAGFFEAQKSRAPHALVLGAGPVFFAERSVREADRVQALFKAETLAASLADAGLVAFAPAANDLALGWGEFARLVQATRASALAANWQAPAAPPAGTAPTAGTTPAAGSAPSPISASQLVELGGMKIGLAGVSLPTFAAGPPDGLVIGAAEQALIQARDQLRARGAELLVALVATERGDALRLAERVPGFQLLIVGKPFDEGEHNDSPTPPELVERTLVVQAPNHLQGVGIVDLFVRGGSHDFADGSGIAALAERQSLEERRNELLRRIEAWRARPDSIRAEDLAAREDELSELNRQLKRSTQPELPATGSYLLYDFSEIRESLGQSGAVAARLEAYYQRVNEHNKQAFADRRPQPVEPGQSGYVGIEVCSSCHQEERKVWDQTAHAGAYATLSRDHKEYNLDCVGCHVTGYEKPGGSTVTHVETLRDVQCEICHGPGSAHAANPVAAGAIRRTPDQGLCASTCHHPPHVGENWNVTTAWPKILGPGHGG